ncbi:MAG: 2-polyprenyl-3-methyl-6-methoxy-1,4-benzoquinone monooxygenase [Pseudomonadales bacterium]|nr:2-polyprenyl-3-methyl-6-methoxy-1,4-benzoquinone monooxygenase [Pseudomonadales bacterium]
MNASGRHFSSLDRLVMQADRALRTLVPKSVQGGRIPPDQGMKPPALTPDEQRHVAGLMRINHTGEVCAQALYQGQALTARLPGIRQTMEQAAHEEIDHLAWCEQRLHSLGYRTSVFNPLWYGISFTLGALAGLAGDEFSLGFVAETEHQVVRHLDQHLSALPAGDRNSRSILEAMKADEARHATTALQAGGRELPERITRLMQAMSRLMTSMTYYI